MTIFEPLDISAYTGPELVELFEPEPVAYKRLLSSPAPRLHTALDELLTVDGVLMLVRGFYEGTHLLPVENVEKC